MSKDMALFNGKFILLNEPVVTVTDRNFLLGDGIFETVKILNGNVVWFKEHYARILASAKFFEMTIPHEDELLEFSKELIQKNEMDNGSLRITASRGASSTGRFGDLPDKSNYAITTVSHGGRVMPLKANFASWQINELDPLASHKTTSRAGLVFAWREAKRRGLDELVFVNRSGAVAEGVIANLFFVKDGVLCTPSLDCGILPGVSRSKVIEVAKSIGVEVSEGLFSKEALSSADEIFFTNSTMLVSDSVIFANMDFSNCMGRRIKNELCKLINKQNSQ